MPKMWQNKKGMGVIKMDKELNELIKKLAEVGNCSYGIALMKAKEIIGNFIENEKDYNSTSISETIDVTEKSRKIKIFYELDYGIFTIKTNNLGLSKTKFNQLEGKIKREIDKFLG